mmetsp:Transcript_8454/g.13315  ORF Transcript_8454/g.13315 Transcript_8454/m.13315 type:complete len:86 (+) Transcript_8454:176-433(+)
MWLGVLARVFSVGGSWVGIGLTASKREGKVYVMVVKFSSGLEYLVGRWLVFTWYWSERIESIFQSNKVYKVVENSLRKNVVRGVG